MSRRISHIRYSSRHMIYNWTGWKHFPDAAVGGAIEAPNGPGVYEVRHTVSGRVVAFGSASNVARALSKLRINRSSARKFLPLFPKRSLMPRVFDLEYRTSAASSRSEARGAARRLLGLKQAAWQVRLATVLLSRRAR